MSNNIALAIIESSARFIEQMNESMNFIYGFQESTAGQGKGPG